MSSVAPSCGCFGDPPYCCSVPYGKCEVHGAGWLVETCRHVAAGVRRQRPIDVYAVEGLLLCSTCVETLGLGAHEARPQHRGWTTVAATFEELGEHYSVVNETSALCCRRCYAQLELSASRDRGLGDPFHAYENTPTSRAIIERLTDALLAAFSFREFRLCSGKQTHALEASPGSLIRPARVVVDFVEDESEQDSIVSAVGAFFRDAPEAQWEV